MTDVINIPLWRERLSKRMREMVDATLMGEDPLIFPGLGTPEEPVKLSAENAAQYFRELNASMPQAEIVGPVFKIKLSSSGDLIRQYRKLRRKRRARL